MEIKGPGLFINFNTFNNIDIKGNRVKASVNPNFNVDLIKKREEIIREFQRIFKNFDKYLEKINEVLNPLNKELRVEIDQELNIPIFKIINKETNEVIRQIPLEEILRIAKNIEKFLESQKIDKKYLRGLLLKAEV
ncbi:flagellar protein FlaG protein [Thermodesulfobacterium geofontis OPF15]|jgi:flagellar protein FlaG|uniref:Flagellar protein FlaG protein n=1 Tax=Thermodesulfobacterium geofontis (strain OPF15) TaxID=795359 RepID=F8C449_THEGP|nr:flagellar protein FlaG [Thermodesulfobacterium geofontis]AEH23709.1 flagellar protein FlaG protein [Thermodesulfobacterium geofontis OPF15]